MVTGNTDRDAHKIIIIWKTTYARIDSFFVILIQFIPILFLRTVLTRLAKQPLESSSVAHIYQISSSVEIAWSQNQSERLPWSWI